jgi:hypothetical protein
MDNGPLYERNELRKHRLYGAFVNSRKQGNALIDSVSSTEERSQRARHTTPHATGCAASSFAFFAFAAVGPAGASASGASRRRLD